MNIRNILSDILIENQQLLDHPLQLKGMLLDRCGNKYKREIHLLLHLLKYGFVKHLQRQKYNFTLEQKLTLQLYERYGLAKELTISILRIWAKVLFDIRIRNDQNSQISFADPALEEAVRSNIYKEKDVRITKEDLESLVVLRGDQRGIKSLEGVEKLINVEHISLQANEITDLTPLLFLRRLKTLFISNNCIQTASVINDFDSIQALDLSYNPITDFDRLSDRTLMLMFDTIGEDISMKANVYTLLTERGFELNIVQEESGGN